MSLRARVLAGLAVIAVVVGAAAVAVPRITAAYLIEQVDDQLEATSLPFRVGEAGEAVFPSAADADDGSPDRPSRIYVGLVDRSGTVASVFVPNYGDDALPRIDGEQALRTAGAGAYTVDSGDDGMRYRILARDAGEFVLVTGLPLDDVDATVSRLVAVELAALAAVFIVLALVAWWVIRLGVRPVKAMAATATEIGAGDLSARVPEYPPATEAGRLGLALNQMLERIEDEFDQRLRSQERLRQFAADASHELRTPVATVRGYAELYRSGGLEDPAELGEAMRRVEQETVRMGALVDDLLRLARLDQGRELERGPVDLATIVTDAGRDAQATEPDRPVTVEVDGPVEVQGDERLLRQLVANLTGNAFVHTDPGVAVTLRARIEGDQAVVEVQDEGAGMGPEVAGRVFERFYRADPSRSRHRGGSGLGLAIVEATATTHGGEVAVITAPGEGTTFRVTLPRH